LVNVDIKNNYGLKNQINGYYSLNTDWDFKKPPYPTRITQLVSE
jgi:hypothetical protein